MNKEQKIQQTVKKHFDTVSDKYETLGTFLYGSQNYNLDTENSDIDTKSIIIPHFSDFVGNKKPVSITYLIDGISCAEVKDIREMFKCLLKQNINFVEILFTKYFYINPKYAEIWKMVVDYREKIARYNEVAALHCMLGMVNQKCKKIQKIDNDLNFEVKEYGYKSKELYQILRLRNFTERYMCGESYKNCLIPSNRDWIFKAKTTHNIPKTKIKEFVSNVQKEINLSIEEYIDSIDKKDLSKFYEVENVFRIVATKIIREKFEEDLKKIKKNKKKFF